MKKLALTLVLSLSMALMGGCTDEVIEASQANTGGQNVEGVADNSMDASIAATVNGKEITKDEFDKTYKFTAENYISVYGQGDDKMLEEEVNGRTFGELLKEQVINSMVVDLIVGEKMVAEGVEASQEEIDQTYDNYKQFELDKNKELQSFLEENNLDEAFIKSRIAKQLLITKYSEQIKQPLLEKIDFSSKEYADEVAKVSARHILVKTEEEANKVIARLEAGESFEDLATELSADTGSAANGGDLGYFWRGAMIQAFEEAAFSLEIGEISKPIQTQFGYHVIRTDGKETYKDLLQTPEGQAQLENKKSELVEAEFKEVYAASINEMMAENDIKINYNALGIKPYQAPVEKESETTTEEQSETTTKE